MITILAIVTAIQAFLIYHAQKERKQIINLLGGSIMDTFTCLEVRIANIEKETGVRFSKHLLNREGAGSETNN